MINFITWKYIRKIYLPTKIHILVSVNFCKNKKENKKQKQLKQNQKTFCDDEHENQLLYLTNKYWSMPKREY